MDVVKTAWFTASLQHIFPLSLHSISFAWNPASCVCLFPGNLKTAFCLTLAALCSIMQVVLSRRSCVGRQGWSASTQLYCVWRYSPVVFWKWTHHFLFLFLANVGYHNHFFPQPTLCFHDSELETISRWTMSLTQMIPKLDIQCFMSSLKNIKLGGDGERHMNFKAFAGHSVHWGEPASNAEANTP